MSVITYPAITGESSSGAWVSSASYASLPAASGYTARQQAWCTDGPCGFPVFSNGSKWIPIGGHAPVGRLQLPVLIAPTFTGTSNGAVTFGTACAAIVPKSFMYFPANSLVAAHSAGFYYVEMSTTTAAVVYNNTFVPAAGTEPTEPGSKTAFAGAVPGGTGVTSEITMYVHAITGGFLGTHSTVTTDMSTIGTTGAGAKTVAIKWGATTLGTQNLGTTPCVNAYHTVKNAGATNSQIAVTPIASVSGNSISTAAIDTTSTFNVSLTCTNATATNWLGITGYISYAMVMA